MDLFGMLLLNPIVWVLVFAIALVIVLKSADLFVDNIVIIGKRLGISEIVLGVTAAAVGTSLPEFGSALMATLGGSADLGVGVVVGANVWNIGGILAVTAIVTGIIKSDVKSITRDGLMALITGILLLVFIILGFFIPGVYNMKIFWLGAIVMIIAYVFYMRILIKDSKADSLENDEQVENTQVGDDNNSNDDIVENDSLSNESKVESNSKSLLSGLLLVVISIIGLGVGCKCLVWSVENFDHMFNVPQLIMGLFVLALFTTLPELFVTLSSAMKGLHDMSMGTVYGSCTFNILIGIGVPALLLFNQGVPIELISLYFDVPVMLGITLLSLLIIKLKGYQLTRNYGLFLLILYIMYVV
ncbi:MAG: calcium/sodium antiporter, partial [Methanobrevibacter sp.]|nr:calcium/sodium antiporter [Methanobrevibacter sp.]